jgi:hypothetical protein
LTKHVVIPPATRKADVQGVIRSWTPHSLKLATGKQTLSLTYDPHTLVRMGEPTVGGLANVWYSKHGQHLQATRLQMLPSLPRRH